MTVAHISITRASLSIALVLLILGTVASVRSGAAAQAGMTLESRRAEPARADSDRDADGVIDALDNCLAHPNTDQRDTDRDGIGNRCDADVDNDGLVDLKDLRILLAHSSSRDADLDGDGHVNLEDLSIFFSLFRRPPGPRLDRDGDGQAEFEDPCPATRRGDGALLPGCSALDLVGEPESVLGPLLDKVSQVRALLTDRRDLGAAQTALDMATNDFDEAIRATRGGGICEGSEAVEDGVKHLALSSAELAAAMRRLKAQTTPPEQVRPFDISEPELAVAGLGLPRQWTRLAQGRAQSIHDALARTCAAAKPIAQTSAIKRVIDGWRRVEMTDGRLFALADPLVLNGAVFDGRRVRVAGFTFGDGTGVLTDVGPAGNPPIVRPPPSTPCVELRIAPVQLFPPFTDGPFLLHSPEGYWWNSQYWLEQGMGLAAVQTCPTPPTPSARSLRYSLEVLVSYRDRKTKLQVSAAPLAPDLGVDDAPVLLPSRIDPTADATLIVTSRVQTCLVTASCSDPTVLQVRTYDLRVFDRGAFCTAAYNQTEFDVNDQVPADFKGAVVNDFYLGLPSDSQPVFEADGYAAPLFLFSTFPVLGTIHGGVSFAVHNHDFYPIHKPDPTKIDFQAVVALLTTGVGNAAGLKWPRALGTRGGHPFQYSCRLPEVVRDVVNFCSGSTEAMYRMPFAPDDFGWTQGQGNLSQGTHKNGYAYDMLAAADTPIHAARGGRVIVVNESNSLGFGDPGCEDWDAACPANKFTVWHQDGSVAEYVHMPLDGVVVEVGDLVKRGEEVAKVGKTGRASETHLHIGTATAPRPVGKNILHLYEAASPTGSGAPLTCYAPKNGDVLRSNNTPWP